MRIIPRAEKRQVLPALATLFALASGGSASALAVERYVVTSWGHSAGLPSTLIYAITQTRDGYLWLGTSDGLVRFDGINFDHQKLIVNSELMLGAVTALNGAHDGALWIGSASGLITKMSGVHLRKCRLGGEIEGIVETSPGDTWVIANSGLYRFANDAAGELTPVESFAAAQILPLFETGTRALTLRTRPFGLKGEKELSELTPRRGHKITLHGRSFILSEDDHSRVWLSGMLSRNEQSDSVFLHDSRGYLWSGSPAAGLIRTDSAGSRTTPDLTNRLIESLFEDREGNIWLGSNNGLYRFRYGKVFSFTTRDGLSTDRVSSVAPDGNAVWVGTQSGLDRIDDFGVRRCLTKTSVFTVYLSKTLGLLVGTSEGVFRVTNSAPVLKPELVSRELTSVTAIEQDTAECVWLLDSEKGLYRWQGRAFVSTGRDLNVGTGRISCIRAQSDETVWIGFSGGGVSVFQNDSFHKSPAVSAVTTGTVYDIYRESPNVIWIGTESGLYCLTGKTSKVWNAKAGLPGNRVLWLRPDGSDWLWLGFSTGIARVRRSNLLRADGAAAREPLCDFYDFEDGLLANPVRQSQAAAALDSEGKLWVTTSAGMAIIDSRHLVKNGVPPPVRIERVVADNRVIGIGSLVRFPPLTKNLEIDYAALSLAVPSKVHFKYQLNGYDKQWQDAGNRRQAFYTNLQPGGYRFQVVAANNDGVWNQQGARIDFNLEPAFSQTQTFKLLCFAAAALIALGFYRLRIQQMKAAWNARFEERLAERTRIAQELHDDLLQSAMGVSLQIELVDSLVDEPPTAKAHLQRALTLSRTLMQKGREVLRDLRDKTRDPGEIAEVLSASIEGARQEGGPEATLTVEGTPRALNPLVADDLGQIGCQAILNAFQHAGAKNIRVYLNYKAAELRLEVNDDGCGINPRTAASGKPGHYGLIGMRERAERIGGSLIIASVAGQGTQLKVSVPGRTAYRNARQHD